ncbi:unnamed protein product [marine sediment metagenome]|uniref:Macro domain-containing protein n=1 Tax=marine sediment metagenome TaxID=412755 RepID=X1TIU5_9ZZZZ
MEKQAVEVTINQAKLRIIQGDITKQDTDAIVNAANSSLMGGGGVDGAIHRAGGLAILEECKQIVARQGRLPTGKAVMTTGGNLKAGYVIHTVGPIWRGGDKGESIVVFAILKEGSTPSVSLKKEVTDHMRRMVGPIATPDEIYFVSKLPKTRSGKIMRRVLKAVANDATIGDLTTLEDEASVEEIVSAYQELKKAKE